MRCCLLGTTMKTGLQQHKLLIFGNLSTSCWFLNNITCDKALTRKINEMYIAGLKHYCQFKVMDVFQQTLNINICIVLHILKYCYYDSLLVLCFSTYWLLFLNCTIYHTLSPLAMLFIKVKRNCQWLAEKMYIRFLYRNYVLSSIWLKVMMRQLFIDQMTQFFWFLHCFIKNKLFKCSIWCKAENFMGFFFFFHFLARFHF